MTTSPTHWFPSVSRVEEIEGELEELEQLEFQNVENISDFLLHISTLLGNAHNFPEFPQHQIRQWIWIASQLRLHMLDFPEVANLAGSALSFMRKVIAGKSKLSTEDYQDLNWVLGSTSEKLTTLVGPTTVRSYLSNEEFSEVESRLEHLKTLPPISAAEHRTRVESQFSEIRALSNKGFMSTLCTKIDALVEAVDKLEGEGAAVAGAALQYLAEEDDVVPDSIGFLGLLDDIYVIEWAYSFIEGHTTWLPFLEEMLERWPFVDDLVFMNDGRRQKLDRWSRYIVCAALSSFFGETQNNLLILRDSGPYGLFAALAVALEIQRSRSISAKTGDQPPFTMNQSILIGDETKQFKVLFAGPCEYAGQNKYWLKVRKNGRITVSGDAISGSRPSPTEHKILSNGNEITEWVRNRHPDPLTHIVKRDSGAAEIHQGVLLLTMKKRVEEFLPLIRPLGVTIPNLFGMRYITKTNKDIDLLGSATDQPLIYACSDPSVALDLIKNRPDHISEWFVIADGATLARNLQASLAASGILLDTRLCAVAELHEREACRDIAVAGLKPWYLQDLDVEVPPLKMAVPTKSNHALDRFFARQHMHWTASRSIHVIEQSFYEGVAKVLGDLRRHLRDRGVGGDPNMEILGMNVSTFLKKALENPLELTSELKNELKILASRIFSYSSILRGYSEDARHICEHFRNIQLREIPAFSREAKLLELLEIAAHRGEKEIAVLCRSSHIASKCETVAKENPRFSLTKWVNMDALRRMSPVDRVIVPGWVDRITMRELANNSYGNHVDLVLLPFELEMFDSGLSAGLRWESKLTRNNKARYAKLRSSVGGKRKDSHRLWRTISTVDTKTEDPKITESAILETSEEEASDFEYLESQVAEAIKNQTKKYLSSDESVAATLVLFEEEGAFAYLPPKGKVIALSDVADESGFGEAASELELGGKRAEDLLFRSVSKLYPGLLLAFPVESDRDMLDARADQFLENAEDTRRISSLWKSALSEYFEKTGESYSEFSRKMAAAGEPREPQTIRSWATRSQSIAPRNYKITVPLISKLTEDTELRNHLKISLDAIQKIYDARAEAAVAIVKEIFSGDINLESEFLTIEIEGTVFTYQLQRVAAIEETREVPAGLVGRVNKLAAGFADDHPPQDLSP